MAAARLAALRARISAKEDTLKAQVRESVHSAIQRAEEEDKAREAKRRAEALLAEKEREAKRARLGINDGGNGGVVNAKSAPSVKLCGCGQEAVRRKVQKEGANKGREFWCCKKQESEGRCRLFEWIVPEAVEEGEPTVGSAPQVPQGPPPPPRCRCGLVAARRAVHKEGPNQGREFLCCPLPSEKNPCNLFEWVAPDTEALNGSPAVSAGNAVTAPEATGVVCYCGQAAATMTVKKNGPNFGRSFLKCAKPQEQQCSFFTWTSDPAPEAANAVATANKYAPGTAIVAPCFKCGKGGHWARECPNVDGGKSGQVGGEGDGALPIPTDGHMTGRTTEQKMEWTPPPPERPQGSGRLTSVFGGETCLKCFASGHWARDCPLNNRSGGGD